AALAAAVVVVAGTLGGVVGRWSVSAAVFVDGRLAETLPVEAEAPFRVVPPVKTYDPAVRPKVDERRDDP
ncbi:MAG TPA: hypothetical protein VEI02_14965, partial [Planctomycetota bacterium]|nr:hypothetical protein [Planctomycetota bacterium]